MLCSFYLVSNSGGIDVFFLDLITTTTTGINIIVTITIITTTSATATLIARAAATQKGTIILSPIHINSQSQTLQWAIGLPMPHVTGKYILGIFQLQLQYHQRSKLKLKLLHPLLAMLGVAMLI